MAVDRSAASFRQERANHVVRYLEVWLSHRRPGIVWVEYENDSTRDLAINLLDDVCRQMGLITSRISVEHAESRGDWSSIRESLKTHSGVVNLIFSGILGAPLLPRLQTREFALSWNLEREEMFSTSLQQIWWLRRELAHLFRTWAPDFFSWVDLNLSLDEANPPNKQPTAKAKGKPIEGLPAPDTLETVDSRWSNLGWSVLARHYFGESLCFYRLSFAAVDRFRIIESLNQLKTQMHLRGLQAFTVFGPVDLIVRVWLPTTNTVQFESQLRSVLPFNVTLDNLQISPADSRPTKDQERLLVQLDDWQIVRALQSGGNGLLLERLVEVGLITVSQKSDSQRIRFLLTLGERSYSIWDAERTRIQANVKSRLVAGASGLLNWRIHSGSGFCHILIDGEVEVVNFFDIGQTVNWLRAEFTRIDVNSYVFSEAEPLVNGPDQIDDMTLIERRPHDPVIRYFAPEAVNQLTPTSDEVLRFLIRNKIALLSLSDESQSQQRVRELIKNCLQAILTSDEHLMMTFLLSYLSQTEGAFRSIVENLIGRLGASRGEIIRHLKIPADRHLSLGDLFKIADYLYSFSESGKSLRLNETLGPLVNLRNRVAHSSLNPSTSWQASLETILSSAPVLEGFIQVMEKK